MKDTPNLPLSPKPSDSYDSRFAVMVERTLSDLQYKSRLAYEDRISGYYSATAAPTGGNWIIGDRVRNKTPAEAGVAGSKYVIIGWICTVTGNPGTWLEMRTLTGN